MAVLEVMQCYNSDMTVVVNTVDKLNSLLYCIAVLRYKALNPLSMLFNLVAE